MRSNHILVLLSVLTTCSVFGQDSLLFKQAPTNQYKAAEEIKALKHGALVVRLKTSDKSVDAYRKAGQEELAKKITEQREAENLKIAEAFKYYFKFCKVYFIYAKNSEALIKGTPHIFLTEKLQPDTSIRLTENYFLIVEYGSYTQNERVDDYHYSGVYRTEPSTSTASTSALVIIDTTLTQLQEPFPFYEPVYLNGFNKGVDHLNAALEKAYSNTLFREDAKQLKKKKGNGK